MIQTYVLILFISAGGGVHASGTSTMVEFTTRENCLAAGNALSTQAQKRGNFVMTWGCFPK